MMNYGVFTVCTSQNVNDVTTFLQFEIYLWATAFEW